MVDLIEAGTQGAVFGTKFSIRTCNTTMTSWLALCGMLTAGLLGEDLLEKALKVNDALLRTLEAEKVSIEKKFHFCDGLRTTANLTINTGHRRGRQRLRTILRRRPPRHQPPETCWI